MTARYSSSVVAVFFAAASCITSPSAIVAAAERQHHGQRNLALAEIISDILAELGGLAAIIQHIVDQLEGDAEIHADRTAGGLLGLGAVGQHRPDLAGGGEQFGGLAADHREIFVFGGGGVLCRRELHHFAFGDGRRRRGENVEREFWRRALERGEIGDSDLDHAIGLMTKHRALEDTINRAQHYGAMAVDALALFPPSAMKTALEQVVAFCLARTH